MCPPVPSTYIPQVLTSSFAEWASLGNIWWGRCEETLMIFQWFLTELNDESCLGSAETKHILKSMGAQEAHNPKARRNVSTVKVRRHKISRVWRQQTSEPWKPHNFSPVQPVCKAEGFFFFFFFYLCVAANRTSADSEEHTKRHTQTPWARWVQASAVLIII